MAIDTDKLQEFLGRFVTETPFNLVYEVRP